MVFVRTMLLCTEKGVKVGEIIDTEGSNLPLGGKNDGEYWIDLPDDDRNGIIKIGNIDNAELYVHVKPAFGGTFGDIAMWNFCPFIGPATIKVGMANWEHYTRRISNFTGELVSTVEVKGAVVYTLWLGVLRR
ncbi:unnamed protein product [Musa textilis]